MEWLGLHSPHSLPWRLRQPQVCSSWSDRFSNTSLQSPILLNSLSPWFTAARQVPTTLVLLPSPFEVRQQKSRTPTCVSFLHSFLQTTTLRKESQTHSPSSDGCSHVGQDSSQDTDISKTQSPTTHHIHEITAIVNETEPACRGNVTVSQIFIQIYLYVIGLLHSKSIKYTQTSSFCFRLRVSHTFFDYRS